jgi:hypothetical protein
LRIAGVAPVLDVWRVFGAAVEKEGEDWAKAPPQKRYRNRDKFAEQKE